MTQKKSGMTSLLGIELDEQQIRVVHAVHRDSSVEIRERYRSPLNLNPLSQPPELVGQEIRNHLEMAGIREKKCLVCIPLRWVLTHFTPLPNLSEEDTQNYIRVQAERSLPFLPDDLQISSSRILIPSHQQYALITAVLSTRIQTLRQILKYAKLQPVSITLGLPLNPQDSEEDNAVHLFAREGHIQLMISAGGGTVALRDLDWHAEEEEKDTSDSMIREIRITLGLLPSDIRNTLSSLRIYGTGEETRCLAEDLQEPALRWGLQTQLESSGFGSTESIPISDSYEYTVLVATVTHFIRQRTSAFEFLPPHVSRIQELLYRVSSRRNLWLGGSAAAVVILSVALFLYQHVRLTSLENQWKSMKDKVSTVETLQTKVRDYRPWFDRSVKSLSIAQTLTNAFPEEGTVWVKNLEIQSLAEVTCSGFASNRQEWMAMIDRLQASEQVKDLKTQQVQGEKPMQFVFRFRWVEGTNRG